MATELDSALKESVIARLNNQITELKERLENGNKKMVALCQDLESGRSKHDRDKQALATANNALIVAQDLLHKFMTRYPALVNYLIPIRDVLTLDKS